MPAFPTPTNHAPVTVALIAGAATNLVLEFMKQRYGLDLGAQQADIQVLATAFGYLINAKGAA